MNKERIGIVNKVVDDIGEMMSEHELTPDRALEVLKIATMIELIQALEERKYFLWKLLILSKRQKEDQLK